MQHKHFIIGNASSVWMKEYIKEIHIRNNIEVYLTVFDKSKLNFEDDYINMGVNLVVLGNNSSKFEKIKKTLRLLWFAFKHRRKNRFSIIEIQSPPHNFQAKVIADVIRIMKSKAFVMFWGSDILSISQGDALKLEWIISKANQINRLSEQAYERFNAFFGNKYDYLLTATPLRFGTLALPYIKKLKENKSVEQCKNALGISDDDAVTIAIGYNGKSRQQHQCVLKELNVLNDEIKHKLFLILHIVGCDSAYKTELINAAKQTNIPHMIIDRSLDFEEISVLRIATDIFIHAQTTDGLSGSIRECLYADTLVINPTWIRYDELKKIGIEYIEYNHFNEIPLIIEKYIGGAIEVDLDKNSRLIYQDHSWENVYTKWIDNFNRLVVE